MGTLKGILKMQLKPLLMAIGAFLLVAVVGALAGTQLSAHLGGNGNIAHLCVNNNSGAIQAIGANETCKTNWSISIRDRTINGGRGPAAVVACGQVAVHKGR